MCLSSSFPPNTHADIRHTQHTLWLCPTQINCFWTFLNEWLKALAERRKWKIYGLQRKCKMCGMESNFEQNRLENVNTSGNEHMWAIRVSVEIAYICIYGHLFRRFYWSGINSWILIYNSQFISSEEFQWEPKCFYQKMGIAKRGPAYWLHNLTAKHTQRNNNASSIFKTLISINRIDYEHPLSRKVMFDWCHNGPSFFRIWSSLLSNFKLNGFHSRSHSR